MSLEIQIKKILENFDDVPSDDFLDVLNQIQNKFQSSITQEYLSGKLKTISQTPLSMRPVNRKHW